MLHTLALAAANATGSVLPQVETANWGDYGIVISGVTLGVIGFIIRWKFQRKADHFFTGLITDVLRGAALFPFLLLAVSLWSDSILAFLLHTNRAFLSICGLIAAINVFAEFLKLAASPPPAGR